MRLRLWKIYCDCRSQHLSLHGVAERGDRYIWLSVQHLMSVEKYLKPEVINQIKRLDLRAQFVVKGFLHGLHASPFHGFSVEFSEHRKYSHGDDLKDIDWQVFAKTDKYYVKKFESETNITGYIVMDLSKSMGYTFRQDMNKFDYAICLAAAPVSYTHLTLPTIYSV